MYLGGGGGDEKMTLYVLNSLIVPINFHEYTEAKVTLKKLSVEDAKLYLKNWSFVSAVGHEGTAKVLSEILDVDIPVNRATVFFKKGDVGIHFFLKQRLPEGKVLSEDELNKLNFWLVMSEVL